MKLLIVYLLANEYWRPGAKYRNQYGGHISLSGIVLAHSQP
jgi:hypothetical protein